jgi:cytochrome c556
MPFALKAGCLAVLAGLMAASTTAVLCQEPNAAALDDEIFARKVVMGTIDRHMGALEEMAASDKPVDLAEASEHADTISVMLMAFPHLFPPSTNRWRPNAAHDPAGDTFASPDVWTNYPDFYAQAATASRFAYDASRALRGDEFKKTVAALRTACDSCHAVYLKIDP